MMPCGYLFAKVALQRSEFQSALLIMRQNHVHALVAKPAHAIVKQYEIVGLIFAHPRSLPKGCWPAVVPASSEVKSRDQNVPIENEDQITT